MSDCLKGCGQCRHGAKSDRIAERIDICGVKYAYLPIYMPVETQRPEWCPGWEGKVESEKTKVQSETAEQQELFGFRRD